jgi:hypothetical protein
MFAIEHARLRQEELLEAAVVAHAIARAKRAERSRRPSPLPPRRDGPRVRTRAVEVIVDGTD